MEREGIEYVTYVDPKDVLAGFPASFADLTREHLREFFIENCFSDAILANHYGVTKYKVKKKREEFHLSYATIIYENGRMESEQYKADNERLREHYCGDANVEWLAKAMTNYAFRQGPIEDMHTDNRFSEDEMKTLNKYTVDRIAEILLCYNSEDYLRLSNMLGVPPFYMGSDWDAPEPDFTKVDKKIVGI